VRALRSAIDRKARHPGVDVLGTINLAGFVDFCIRGQRFFDEVADLFFVCCVAFDRLVESTNAESGVQTR
jgi:hypothetical protein